MFVLEAVHVDYRLHVDYGGSVGAGIVALVTKDLPT